MYIYILILFYFSAFIIFWAMVGYPLFIITIGKLFKKRVHLKNYNFEPSVTILVVAHNEESVIEEKLNNLCNLNYPNEKLEILISSDNSVDKTNNIVRRFIEKNPMHNIRLYEVEERKGKTNAQNEAARTVESELLIMTDANSIFKNDAVNEIVSSFVSDDIKYVCGKLEYINKDKITAGMENTYWNLDLKLREIESNIQTITAGNGALYAVRTKDYIDIPLIESHDSSLPFKYARDRKKAVFNKDAIVYEKAGETVEDEFKRKVRMNRNILSSLYSWIKIVNIFKYKWFTIFYLGHRTSRNLLWIMHLILLITNVVLSCHKVYFKIILIAHVFIYFVAIFQQIFKTKIKVINLVHYYIMTIVAQWVGAIKQLFGKSKPFWDKAGSTR